MDALQWMGAVRMRVQTSDKNITSNPHHSSPSVNILRSQKLFVRNKSIIKMFITSNRCLNMSPLSIIMLPQWKSCLVWIRIEICTVQAPIINKNSSKQICVWITEEALLWNIDSYFVQKQRFEVKNTLMMNLFLTNSFWLLKMLLDGLEWCGLLWCFYQMFGLSFWRHPFTAEHPLLSKWCNATFLQIWWRNKLS